MIDAGRALRAYRLGVLEVASLISIPIVLVAIYGFDFPLLPGLAMVVVGVGASMVANLMRFRAERQQTRGEP